MTSRPSSFLSPERKPRRSSQPTTVTSPLVKNKNDAEAFNAPTTRISFAPTTPLERQPSAASNKYLSNAAENQLPSQGELRSIGSELQLPTAHSTASVPPQNQDVVSGGYSDSHEEGFSATAAADGDGGDGDGGGSGGGGAAPPLEVMKDEDNDLSDSHSNSSHGSGTTNSTAIARSSGFSIVRCGGRTLKIPFTFWTFLSMAVPVLILIGLTGYSTGVAVAESDLIQRYAPVVQSLEACVAALAVERGVSGPWLVTGSASDWNAYQAAIVNTNTCCLQQYTNQLRLHTGNGPALLNAYNEFLSDAQQLAVWRQLIMDRTANGPESVAFYTSMIGDAADIVTPIADELQQSGRLFEEINLIISCYNYIGLARGVGNAIMAMTPGAVPLSELLTYAAANANANLSCSTTSSLAGTWLAPRFTVWLQNTSIVLMWSIMGDMAANATAAQLQFSGVWWDVLTNGLSTLAELGQDHLNYVASAQAIQGTVNLNIGFLVAGVFGSAIAGALLAWQQSRVRVQLERQVALMAQTKKAVGAFVPRFFLRQMGYTAITQVRAGESTKVALSMLFADIRRFTTVSEGMDSEALFNWVQGYFKRMTAIVESKHGNVNEFIGDALFAMFSSPVDSVRCAIAMQADVQQLNINRLCLGTSRIPVEIGVGIHHDVVALGILGGVGRHTCTAISSSVNLASRLEGLTKQLGCRIIASDSVVSQIAETHRTTILIRKLGAVIVKGSRESVVIHDIFQADDRSLLLCKEQTRDEFEELIDILEHQQTCETPSHMFQTPHAFHVPEEAEDKPATASVEPNAEDAWEAKKLAVDRLAKHIRAAEEQYNVIDVAFRVIMEKAKPGKTAISFVMK